MLVAGMRDYVQNIFPSVKEIIIIKFFSSSNFHFRVQLRLMAIGHCKSVQKITSFTSDVGGVHFSLVMADLITLVF